MIKVKNEVGIYEIEGEEAPPIEGPTIEVLSHWNRDDLVVLKVDEKSYTVLARDLNAAISNATHTK